MPKLSVIVPIYNVEKFLPECIESAVNQPFESEDDFEVILVNDGSPDKCLSICREYEKKYGNVRVVNQANAGVSAARNAGLDCATGEYVCFLDGDDCFLPGVLPSLVAAAKAHDVDMLSFSACSGTDFEKSRAFSKTGGGGLMSFPGGTIKYRIGCMAPFGASCSGAIF